MSTTSINDAFSGGQSGDTSMPADLFCASCGTKEGDGIKLKICTACKSVRYCGVECQRKHRPKHKRDCKRRVAELRDEILFKQPESSHCGDCPICFLPLPLEPNKYCLQYCCSKSICNGCSYANFLSRHGEEKCPYCRSPRAKSEKEELERKTRRVELKDPVAIRDQGLQFYHEGKYKDAFDYYKEAAELGDAEAHYHLSILYSKGQGVEKDDKRSEYHAEEAAIGGHPGARLHLAQIEMNNGRDDRAVKHMTIGANQGDIHSIQMLKEVYKMGLVSKDVLAVALRTNQAAIDERKSPQREAADAVRERMQREGLW